MEMKSLDRRGMAETAQFLHLKDPETGKPMYDGDTAIGPMVKGLQSRSVQAALATIKRAEVTGEASHRTLEEVQADGVRLASLVTVEVLGVTQDGKPLTPDQFPGFYDLTFLDMSVGIGRSSKTKPGSFAQQVERFISDGSNFLQPA